MVDKDSVDGTEPAAPVVETRGRLNTVTILSVGLAVTVILLGISVLVGVITDREPLTDLAVRILTVAIAATAGVLGFEAAKNRKAD